MLVLPKIAISPEPCNDRLARPILARGVGVWSCEETALQMSILLLVARSGPGPQQEVTSAVWRNADLNTRQTLTGGRVNSRWLQAPDLDLFSGLSLVVEPCSV